MSAHDQISFTSQSECEKWTPNKFKADKCQQCSHFFSDHSPASVTEDEIIVYLNYLNAKNPCNEILPTVNDCGALYLGSYQALMLDNLTKYQITKAVQTAKNLEYFFVGWGRNLKEIEDGGKLEVLRLHWVDGEQQKIWKETPWDQLEEAIRFIHSHRKNKQNVVVNCAQGKSRSSTVVIAYIMVVNNMNFQEALAYVRSKRSIADPNSFFVQQLKEFETSTKIQELRNELNGQ